MAANKHDFLDALAGMATEFGWRVQSFERGEQCVGVVGFEATELFEQMVWIHDPQLASIRCLLTVREKVPALRLPEMLEFCARVNDGLVFGCLEYDFSDLTLSFRDSSEVDGESFDTAIRRLTSRLLSLGERYRLGIAGVLAGTSAFAACEMAEQGIESGFVSPWR